MWTSSHEQLNVTLDEWTLSIVEISLALADETTVEFKNRNKFRWSTCWHKNTKYGSNKILHTI